MDLTLEGLKMTQESRNISLLYNRIIVSVVDPTMHCPTYCMDLTLEGLKMTQDSRNM
jgi:hypothetical protein